MERPDGPDLNAIEGRLNAMGPVAPLITTDGFAATLEGYARVRYPNGGDYCAGVKIQLYRPHAEFLAAAPGDVRDLLAHVRRLEGQLARHRAMQDALTAALDLKRERT